ncbi:MAG: ACT domain-containing protein [Desulfuromonadales bacterium]|nr:ACT domain-containing protein [Desulfuromonadales bacterium]
MDNRFIMTAFGKDRPGITADVTKLLYENGCNLEETTMTLLADEFTVILLFSCKDEHIDDQLLMECRRLERDKGISAFVRPLARKRQPKKSGFSELVLHVEGLDQTGIVYKISQFLADEGLNIVDLKSVVEASPQSGTAIYVMDIHIQVPDGISVESIEQGLSDVADDLHVDISLVQ